MSGNHKIQHDEIFKYVKTGFSGLIKTYFLKASPGLQNMQPVRVHHYEYLVPIFVETAVMKCFTFSEGRFA